MGKEIMVKVCSKCGIANSEKAEECEACGAELGEPITNKEAKKLSKQIAKKNEKLKNAIAAEKFGGKDEEDPIDIPVTPAHIVIGVIGCLAAVCEIVIMVLSNKLFPGYTYEMILGGIGTLVLLAVAILDCFMPSMMWTLGHYMDRFYYKEMPRPSDVSVVLQMIGSVLLILIGSALITMQILLACGIL